MKILLCNDDGYHAQGINTLFDVLSKDHEVTMIAPHQERSSCGHGITLGEPIRIVEHHENIYSCSGYPADCVLIGLGHIMNESKPDLIVSGINHGANLGQDRFYSGTMAAAREGAFRGVPSIAVSLVSKFEDSDEYFQPSADLVLKLIENGIIHKIPNMHLLNINSPNLPQEKLAGVKLTKIGFQNYSEEVVERVDTRGRNYYWVGGVYKGHSDIAGSDCNAVAEGYISVNLQSMSEFLEPGLEDSIREVLESL